MSSLPLNFELPRIYLSEEEINEIKYSYIKAHLTNDNYILHTNALLKLAKDLVNAKIKPPKELLEYLETEVKKLKNVVKKSAADLRSAGFDKI